MRAAVVLWAALAGAAPCLAADPYQAYLKQSRQAARAVEALLGETDDGAAAELEGLARKGNPVARFFHATTLEDEAAAEAVYKKVLPLLRDYAGRGDPLAQLALAEAYDDGSGAERDEAEALKWLRKAAGNAKAPAAAQHNLALAYQSGLGAAPDPVEALKWYLKAASRGFPPSQNNLGQMIDAGEGTAADPAGAARWFREAAEQGLAAGQNNFARAYEVGRGLPASPADAACWYALAAFKGLGPAAERREALEKVLTAPQREEARRLVDFWTEAEACRRDGPCAARLAEAGASFVSRSRWEEAVGAYEKLAAARPRSARVRNNLGFVRLMKGDLAGARKDVERALALDPGDAMAMVTLAEVEAASKRPEEACRWLKAGLEAGYKDAGYIAASKTLDGVRSHPCFAAAVK